MRYEAAAAFSGCCAPALLAVVQPKLSSADAIELVAALLPSAPPLQPAVSELTANADATEPLALLVASPLSAVASPSVVVVAAPIAVGGVVMLRM